MKEGKISYSFLITILFVSMMVTDMAFRESVQLYKIPKYLMLCFFILMFLWLLSVKRVVSISRSLITPTLFVLMEWMSCLWAVNSSVVLKQFITQAQLYILFLFVFFSLDLRII